jgi:segregation and condensation protein B
VSEQLPETEAQGAPLSDENDDTNTQEPLAGREQLGGILEAILLVVDEPVSEGLLAQVVELPTGEISAELARLAAEYRDTERGFELREVAGGWRLYTREEFAPYVERFIQGDAQTKLTQAALETLSVVAYKQPVTRARVSSIRGVNCDGVLRTLVTRGLVTECGQDTGGGYLYSTTPLFLEKLGLRSLEELPAIAPLLPDADMVDDVLSEL